MSTAGRKATTLADKIREHMRLFSDGVNDRYVDDVNQAAADKSARLSSSIEKFDKARKALVKKGTPEEEATRIASKELDTAAELVRRHAVEAKDSGDVTVLADIANALMTLDPNQRAMVLRRAGNPEVFQSLLDKDASALPGDASVAAGQARVNAEEKNAKKEQDRDRLPLIQRPSAHLQQQGRVGKSGKLQKPSQIYKNHLPRNDSPMDVDTSARRETLETQGQEALDKMPRTGAEKRALKTLAGDQISQLRRAVAMQRGFDLTDKAQKKQFDALMKATADDRGITVEELEIQLLREAPPEALTLGTPKGRGGGLGDKSDKWGGRNSRSIDREVDARNKGSVDRLLAQMYELTEPRFRTDEATGGVALDAAGNAIQDAPGDTWLNLNEVFPIFRARIGERAPDGTMMYPSTAWTPEFLTAFMQGFFNSQDPDFVQRMLPLVRRSLEKTPAETGLRLLPGGEIQRPNSRLGGRGAAFYDKEQFVPSPSMDKAMQSGLGSPGYPIKIYGDKPLARPELDPPALTPTPDQSAPDAAPQLTPEMLERIERARKQLGGEAGNDQTTSIYTVPQGSPLRTLMA